LRDDGPEFSEGPDDVEAHGGHEQLQRCQYEPHQREPEGIKLAAILSG
jgi:hypothetical protein